MLRLTFIFGIFAALYLLVEAYLVVGPNDQYQLTGKYRGNLIKSIILNENGIYLSYRNESTSKTEDTFLYDYDSADINFYLNDVSKSNSRLIFGVDNQVSQTYTYQGCAL